MKKVKSLLDDDDDLIGGGKPTQPVNPTPIVTQPIQNNNHNVKNSDPFDILGLDIGGTSNPNNNNAPKTNNAGGDLLGGFSFTNNQPTQPQFGFNNQSSNQMGGGLFDAGFLGGSTQPTQSQPQSQPVQNNNNSLGFDFLGTGSGSSGSIPQTTVIQTQNTTQSQFGLNQPQQNTFKFKAYETPHV